MTLKRRYALALLGGTLLARPAMAQAREFVDSAKRKISLPAEALRLQKRLKIPDRPIAMIRTASRLIHEVLTTNWRTLPAQFGTPAVSQILAGLVLDAGYEAIRYPSTKGDGECVAVFPHRLASDTSFLMLADDAPTSVRHIRLDLSVADDLCGWEVLPGYLRSRRV